MKNLIFSVRKQDWRWIWGQDSNGKGHDKKTTSIYTA